MLQLGRKQNSRNVERNAGDPPTEEFLESPRPEHSSRRDVQLRLLHRLRRGHRRKPAALWVRL